MLRRRINIPSFKVGDYIYFMYPNNKLNKIPSSSCTGVCILYNNRRIMIEKYEDYKDSLGLSYSRYNWGACKTNQTKIPNYTMVGGGEDGDEGYLLGSSSPQLSRDPRTWTSGALGDWSGKSHSEIIKGLLYSGSSWTSSETIGYVLTKFLESETSLGYGDWYIPSCGQLALICLMIDDVNNSLIKIGGNPLTTIGTSGYWSSSEMKMYGGEMVSWYVDFSKGHVGGNIKSGEKDVRFIRDV